MAGCRRHVVQALRGLVHGEVSVTEPALTPAAAMAEAVRRIHALGGQPLAVTGSPVPHQDPSVDPKTGTSMGS